MCKARLPRTLASAATSHDGAHYAPEPDNGSASGCGFQLFGLLLLVGLYGLLQYLGWWPQERGWRTALALVGAAGVGGVLAVALAGPRDKVLGR